MKIEQSRASKAAIGLKDTKSTASKRVVAAFDFSQAKSRNPIKKCSKRPCLPSGGFSLLQVKVLFCALTIGLLMMVLPAQASRKDVVVKIASLPEQYDDVHVRNLSFSPDGSLIVVDSDGDKINVWDWRNRKIEKVLQRPKASTSPKSAFQFSEVRNQFISCQDGKTAVRVWNISDWSIASDVKSVIGNCQGAKFSPDGAQLLRLSDVPKKDGLIAYSTDSWSVTWGLQFPRFVPSALAVDFGGKFVAISGITYVPPVGEADPNKIYQQTKAAPTIIIVDLHERKIARTIDADAEGAIAWSPNGRRLAVAGRGYVEIFDAFDGQRLAHEKLKVSADMNVLYSPDGRLLIESDNNESGNSLGLNIWDADRKQLQQHISGNFSSMDVSRDGTSLALGEKSKTTIWQFK